VDDNGIRVLVAKIGLDGHDRGAKVLLSYLKDAGFDVIYSGLRNTSRQVLETAIQEDVQAVGVSILSGSHKELIGQLCADFRNNSASEIKIFVGGVIPEADIEPLLALGVDKVFSNENSLADVIDWLRLLERR
jgi:methylmalonyl-CoA mutase C-terminal domain/subunit